MRDQFESPYPDMFFGEEITLESIMNNKSQGENPFQKEVIVLKGASVGKSDSHLNFTIDNIKKAADKLREIGMTSNSGSWPREEQAQVINGLIPSKSNCYRIITFRSKDPNKSSHASLGKTDALKKYEESFFIQCNKYRNANIDGYFELEVAVYYPNQRSDLDNSLKVLLDCLQKVNAIKNDNKCTRIVANKFLDKDRPRIEFTIKLAMNVKD